jgi:hypothetical protein
LCWCRRGAFSYGPEDHIGVRLCYARCHHARACRTTSFANRRGLICFKSLVIAVLDRIDIDVRWRQKSGIGVARA